MIRVINLLPDSPKLKKVFPSVPLSKRLEINSVDSTFPFVPPPPSFSFSCKLMKGTDDPYWSL